MAPDAASSMVYADKHERMHIRCSTFDALLKRVPITIALFYDHASTPEALRAGLVHALGDYPLLAGRLAWDDGQLELLADNQGASFTQAHHGSR